MRSDTFDAFDDILASSFLSAFKLAWNTNEIHEGVAMRLLHFFMKGSFTAPLNARLSTKPFFIVELA